MYRIGRIYHDLTEMYNLDQLLRADPMESDATTDIKLSYMIRKDGQPKSPE